MVKLGKEKLELKRVCLTALPDPDPPTLKPMSPAVPTPSPAEATATHPAPPIPPGPPVLAPALSEQADDKVADVHLPQADDGFKYATESEVLRVGF